MRPVSKFTAGAPLAVRRRLAAVVAAAALPWLATGDPGMSLLGVIALVSAAALLFASPVGQSLLVACGAVAAVLVASGPLLAGTWPAWGDGLPGIVSTGSSMDLLVWLPCLLMAVARGWGIQNCRNFLGEE